MQETESSIKASNVHLFLIQDACRGECTPFPWYLKLQTWYEVETSTRDFPYEEIMIGYVID